MAMKRLILEMGLGTDLHGEDYTKAAIRGVKNAIHHSSLTLFRSLNLESREMCVKVTIGIPKPQEVDKEQVRNCLPHGKVTVLTVPGGLHIEDTENKKKSVVASVGVEAFYDIQIERLKP